MSRTRNIHLQASSPHYRGFSAPFCGKIRGIIFDLDDTLAPEEAFVFSAFHHISGCLERHYGHSRDRFFQVMKDLFTRKEKKVFNRTLESFDLAYSNDDILQLIELYRSHIPDQSYGLYPDCHKYLPLFFKGYRCAIITDGHYAMQLNKLKKLGIESRFDPIIINSETVLFKPHKGAYEKVLAEWGQVAESILCIGDNPLKDFIAPLAMGMITVRIRRKGLYSRRRGSPASRARYTVRSLEELHDILAR